VQRATPKILASLTRAVNLTESTLAFGRAEEPSPKLERIRLADIAEDVVENERLTSDHATDEACITYTCEVPGDLVLRADPEQLHRVLSNLVRNARQAIAATGKSGRDPHRGVERDGSWRIEVCDTGPACRKRRSITCSNRSMAARARGARASASPSRRRSSAAMAARSNWWKADPRARPSRSAFPRACRLTTPRATAACPESPCALC
jgi:nitrogen fixation/metabolism regulation signal transduction histidine kinase